MVRDAAWLSCPFTCLVLLSGCGDSSDGAAAADGLTGGCAVDVRLTGAVDIVQPGSQEVACAIPHSFDTGLSLVWIPTATLSGFSVDIEDVTEGETGAFPGVTSVQLDDGRRWRTPEAACLVELTEHSLERTEASEVGEMRHYAISGHGSCSEAAEPLSNDTEGLLTVGPFQFVGSAVWRD